MTTAHLDEHAEIPPPKLEEVSPGIFGYIQLDGTWGLNNTGFIAGSDSVTVIDTCFTEKRSRAFLAAVQKGAPGKAIRTLVNTHHHGDHTHGNYVFLPAATIIGHERCRAEVIATGHATSGLFPGVDWGKFEIAPPFVTFEERLTLYVDDLRVELIYMGPAHTTNDVIAWIPERKLLFSGDLIFNGGTPFVMMGSVAGTLTALDRLRALGAETIVPGHGEVCGPEAIEANADYLRFVQDIAKAGFKAGKDPLSVARDTDLGRFASLTDKERLAGNLHRAYSELRGEPWGTPLNLAAVFGEMIAYNDGKPPRCLA